VCPGGWLDEYRSTGETQETGEGISLRYGVMGEQPLPRVQVRDSLKILIAMGAILVSLLSIYFSFRANKKSLTLQKEQTEMQKRITQIEESRERERAIQSQKACLKAELREVERNNHRYHCLVIENSGQGTARNVKATLDGKPILEHPAIASGQQEIILIGPDSEISYIAVITLDCSPPFEFKVTWEDGSGEPGEYETTLTIG